MTRFRSGQDTNGRRLRVRVLAIGALLATVGAAAWAGEGAAGPKIQRTIVGYQLHYADSSIRPEIFKELCHPAPSVGGIMGVNYHWYYPRDMGLTTFNLGVWKNWNKLHADGILTRERPKDFDALLAQSWEYSQAREQAVAEGVSVEYEDLTLPALPQAGLEAGQTTPWGEGHLNLSDMDKPAPVKSKSGWKPRTPEKPGKDLNAVNVSNPDLRQVMKDLVVHGLKQDGSTNLPVRCRVLVDGAGTADFGIHSRKRFDAWVRAHYTPDQIRSLLQTDPDKPIPMRPASGSPDLYRVYRVLAGQFFTYVNGEWVNDMLATFESVAGKGKILIVENSACLAWYDHLALSGINPTWWGPGAGDSWAVEGGGRWSGAWRTVSYAAPELGTVGYFAANLFDFHHGAARLWGEPVQVKPYWAWAAVNPQVTHLGIAHALALQGNILLYLLNPDKPSEYFEQTGQTYLYKGWPSRKPSFQYVPATWVLPMVRFVHKIDPQVRQMIPAGPVGVLYCVVDYFAGFAENRDHNAELLGILYRQHVPSHMVELVLLERNLKERPLQTIVVPWLRCVKDSQAAALREFVNGGGRIVFIGNECGAYTWEGVKREKSAFADIMPEIVETGMTTRDVGKGRTVFLPGSMQLEASNRNLEWHQKVQEALFAAAGATPSVVRPDEFPSLGVTLARNSDNSTFWAQLVNYDVNLKAQHDDPEKCGRDVVWPLENVRVVIPLPAGLKARSVILYRPGLDDMTLEPEQGLEGCAVTVPRVDIYALVAVKPEPGSRPRKTLLEVKDAAEAVKMVAKNLERRHYPSTKVLVPPPCDLPKAEGGDTPRTLAAPALAYVSVDARKSIRMVSGGGEVTYDVYGMDGQPVANGVVPAGRSADVPTPAAGVYTVSLGAGSVGFQHEGAACFEASRYRACKIDEKGDSPPFYFYVPRKAQSFVLKCVSGALGGAKADPKGRESAVDSLYAIKLLVKDPAGKVVLEHDEPLDSLVPFTVAVPPEYAGKVWSVVFADQKAFDAGLPRTDKAEVTLAMQKQPPPQDQAEEMFGELQAEAKQETPFDVDKTRRFAGCKPKGFVHFYLEGVPPVVANTPGQLLIAKGDE